MNYIELLAAAIKAEVDPARLPKADTRVLFRIYAVLALGKGTAVTGEDVHNAWSAWISEHKPDHPSAMPFSELSADKQRQDDHFVEAIHRVVAATQGSALTDTP